MSTRQIHLRVWWGVVCWAMCLHTRGQAQVAGSCCCLGLLGCGFPCHTTSTTCTQLGSGVRVYVVVPQGGGVCGMPTHLQPLTWQEEKRPRNMLIETHSPFFGVGVARMCVHRLCVGAHARALALYVFLVAVAGGGQCPSHACEVEQSLIRLQVAGVLLWAVLLQTHHQWLCNGSVWDALG